MVINISSMSLVISMSGATFLLGLVASAIPSSIEKITIASMSPSIIEENGLCGIKFMMSEGIRSSKFSVMAGAFEGAMV